MELIPIDATPSAPRKQKPAPYDSLTNMVPRKYKGEKTYHHFIGQTLMYYGNPYTSSSQVKGLKANGRYRITEILPDIPSQNLYKRFRFQNIDTGEIGEEGGLSDSDYNFKWLVVGHLEKIKSLYVGKEFLLLDANDSYTKYNNLINPRTNEVRTGIKENTIWVCTDVLARHRHKEDGLINDNRSPIVLIFENKTYGDVYCYLEQPFGMPDNSLICGRFMLKSEYDKRKNDLIKKYGQYNAKLILAGTVRIGMSKAMCKEAWGEPIRINTTTNKYGRSEQWVYGSDSYLYFENGKLTAIQN